ncbi:MAG: DNA primase [Acidobacteria bacterium RIFCSPLOWO2_02_FULL_67_36]|nr:MAG: DNA primase [Acidobacteria bacterium RIFCSPLOWO2_02_FULL_67_36]OFW23881.1 MAG: DNA primase [Acidobacteria bacterium RIFCSPLOWO2_12_FULL_66_21]
MPLFPASFVDDLKSRADIVQVVQERVPLKKSGVTWKGLCPFHGEKTPSFHVNGDKGFFHCFGCGVGGDVIKFVELYDKVTFPEAVRQLAARVGLTVPEPEDSKADAESQRTRETLLKAHEVALAWFREQLATPAGAAARRLVQERGLTAATVELLGIGYAPAAREGLKTRLVKEGFPVPILLQSGLVVAREGSSTVDRFRNRLMIPIHRDNGAVVAFGGRAMEAGQQPKYLNSPETPIYVKGRTLYGLHLSKSSISRAKHAVMVEGYFDFAQAYQAGITNVVASSGTALTPMQAKLLKRFAAKVVLSFDPDAAGQGAAARSSELLVAEGFQVNVAMLPPGDDPDNFIRKAGGAAYQEELRNSRQYLEYLLDRTAAEHDFSRDESRRAFLNAMLAVAARIPDAAARDQFADRLAHKARITEEVVRAEIRKAAVERQTVLEDRQVPSLGHVKPAERGLIWAVMRDPAAGMAAMADVNEEDLEGLAAGAILRQARSLQGSPAAVLPETLLERLTKGEAGLVQEICRQASPPAAAADCVGVLKRLRLDRERAEVQREIDRLQAAGSARNDVQMNALLGRMNDLSQQIDRMKEPPPPSRVAG